MSIKLEEYNSKWPKIYKKEASLIKKALEDSLIEIHHIGSTSIPKLKAKPKIDILVIVDSFKAINEKKLENIGFEVRGEIISTGRYFSKRKPFKINLHIFEKGNPNIENNLLFRDWLRDHPKDRQAYEELKIKLSKKHTDGMEYCKDKTEFINAVIAKAKKIRH